MMVGVTRGFFGGQTILKEEKTVMFIDARSSWNQLTAAHLALVLVVAMSAAVQAAPVNGSHAFETAAECNRAETGHVEFGLDVYGSFGSAVSDGSDALFDPANDDPDRGARGTVYESMPFLCRSQGGATEGLGWNVVHWR